MGPHWFDLPRLGIFPQDQIVNVNIPDLLLGIFLGGMIVGTIFLYMLRRERWIRVERARLFQKDLNCALKSWHEEIGEHKRCLEELGQTQTLLRQTESQCLGFQRALMAKEEGSESNEDRSDPFLVST